MSGVDWDGRALIAPDVSMRAGWRGLLPLINDRALILAGK